MLDETNVELDAGLRPPAPLPRAELPGPIALLRVLRDNPLEAWCRVHFERPVVAHRFLNQRIALVSEPSAVRRVLAENAGNYCKDPLQRRVLSAGLGSGLLAAEGERWRAQRRALAPVFSPRNLARFAPVVIAAAEALAARWCDSGCGAVDVAAGATRLALVVLERTIFADGLGRDPETVRRAMTEYFEAIGRIHPFDLFGVPTWVPRFGRLRAPSIQRYLDATVDDIVARRRRTMRRDPAGVPRDLLTLLIEAHDPETGTAIGETELRSNILTFISAGQETTANALTWSLYLLSQSPAWRAQVEAEARRELSGPREGLYERLVVTRAVVDEALRLYPPIAAVSRIALGPDSLAGHAIARGTIVVVAPYVLHRHRMMWTRPDIFDPGRFLGRARETIDRFAYLPFGIGPRTCIGAGFALQEATLALAILTRAVRLAPALGHAVRPVQRVTLRPRGGLPMIVRRNGA